MRPPAEPSATERPRPAGDAPPASPHKGWGVALLLIAATFASTLYVGAFWAGDGTPPAGPLGWLRGWVFAVPLMAILLSHELGHYIAGRLHGVDISPPYFIPMPIFLLGTMGAIIRMRGAIRTRNALLDIGAAGPLAGMAVALPVLVYGIATSPVAPIPLGPHYVEGHSLLYSGLIFAIKGPIPAGSDIMLNATALAGWAGLLVTMINLIPFGQLDGGHVAYALLGRREDRFSRWSLALMPALAVVVSLAYGVPSWLAGDHGDRLVSNALAGMQWGVWGILLLVMTRFAGIDHPPTDDDTLSPKRRVVAVATLALFVLLFMPTWFRIQ